MIRNERYPAHIYMPRVYDSFVSLPLGLVTLTPKALALAMISTRFLEETAWPIL